MPLTSASAAVLKMRGSRYCTDDAVLVEAVPAFGARLLEADAAVGEHDVAGAQADAREQVHRAVLAPHVAAPDLEEPARRDLEPLLGLPALSRRPQTRAPLHAAAVADGRGRRFLDLHEHVAPRLAGMAQLLDAHAAEQPERSQPLLALDPRRVAQRLARPQQQLALDRFGARPVVADDDDVIDDDLRTLADGKADVGARVVLRQRGARSHRDALVPAVAVLQIDPIAIRGHLDLRERAVRRRRHHGAQLVGREDRVARERHVADERSRPFDDPHGNLDPLIVGGTAIVAARQLGPDGFHHRARKAARAVDVADGANGGVERRLHERLAGLQRQQLLQLGIRHGHVAVHPDHVNDMPAPALHREGDGQLAVTLDPAVVGEGIAVAADVEILFDRTRRVLEEVLIGRSLEPDRHQPLAVRFRQRISRKRHRHTRSTVDRHRDGCRTVGRKVHRVDRPRLVVVARAEVVFVALKLAANRLRVVGLPLPHRGLRQERVAIDRVELLELDSSDDRARPRFDVEHHRGAIGVVRFLDTRRDASGRVAAARYIWRSTWLASSRRDAGGTAP